MEKYLKFNVTCPKCRNEYILQYRFLKNKDSVTCSNCEKQLEKETVDYLKNICSYIMENKPELEANFKAEFNLIINPSYFSFK